MTPEGVGEGVDERLFCRDQVGEVGIDVVYRLIGGEGEAAQGKTGGEFEYVSDVFGQQLIDAPVPGFEVHGADPEAGAAGCEVWFERGRRLDQCGGFAGEGNGGMGFHQEEGPRGRTDSVVIACLLHVNSCEVLR